MIFIFDLDETLYVEKNFVLSGFKVVAKYLNAKHNFNYQKTFKDFSDFYWWNYTLLTNLSLVRLSL